MHPPDAGVGNNAVRLWLKHSVLDTTSIFTESGLEGKARVLAE